MPQRNIYQIRPTLPFFAASEMFVPGREYRISEDLYNGKTADGQNVKDLCEAAQLTEEW
jgi:hypothetical protein